MFGGLKSALSSVGKLAMAVLVTVALVSAYLNILGVRLLMNTAPGDWVANGTAIVIGIGVFAALLGLWSHALAIAPEIRSTPLIRCAFVAVAFTLLLVLGVSSWYNVTVLGHVAAFELDIAQSVEKTEYSVAAATERAKAVRKVLPNYEAISSDLLWTAEQEGCCGLVTGLPGYGGTYQTLRGWANRIRSDLDAAEASLVPIDELVSQAEVTLVRQRAALENTGKTIDSRLNQASAAVTQVNAVLASLANIDGAAALLRSIRSMEKSLLVSAAVRTDRQREGVDSVRDDLLLRLGTLRQDLMAITSLPSVELVTFKRRSPLTAVVVHFSSLLAAWAAGFALDLVPVMFLVWRILAAIQSRGGGGPSGTRTRAWNAEELIDAYGQIQEIQALARRGPSSKQREPNPKPKRPQQNGAAPNARPNGGLDAH